MFNNDHHRVVLVSVNVKGQSLEGMMRTLNLMVVLSPLLLSACGDFEDDAGVDVDPSSPTAVTFTVYTDANCTQLPQRNSVVHLDASLDCNETPDSSISGLKCFEDRISYTNHPNTSDCSANDVENVLYVGVCQEFPGPVPTWKYISPETYHCLSE